MSITTSNQQMQDLTQTERDFVDEDMLSRRLPHITRGVCAKNVYHEGYSLCEPITEAFSVAKETIDQMCNDLTQASLDAGQSIKFDCFFQDGHPRLLYLGDYQQAIRTCCANVALIRTCLPLTVEYWMENTGKPLPFNAAGLITIGQALNGHKDTKSTQ